jgi:hypothetical protein
VIAGKPLKSIDFHRPGQREEIHISFQKRERGFYLSEFQCIRRFYENIKPQPPRAEMPGGAIAALYNA